MRGSRLMSILGVLLAVGLLAGACSSSNKTSSGSTTPATTGGPSESPSPTESEGGTITIGSDMANDHGTKDVTGKAQTEVELDDFYFEPTVIKGSAGAQITLELSNEGSALHNFTLQDQNIDQDVQAGAKEEVTVTFPQSGFLEFFCKYHKALGMVGELTA
jgi:plastocyanin